MKGIEEKQIEAPYELPKGWKWCRLGEVAEIIMGQSPTGTSMTENQNDIAFIGGASDMGEELPNISRYTSEPTKLSKRDDVIVCIRATLGRPIFSDGIYCLGRGVAGIRSETLMKEYIKYGFLNFEQYLYDKATGSTFLQVSSKYLNEMPFPLPPTLTEQQRIVNRIESMFAKLDEAKEKAQNVVDGFETRKAAILHKAFTGELTAKWRKENGVSDDSWVEKRLEEVCDFITKGTTPKKEDMSIGNGEIPYIKVYNLCFNTNLDFTIDPTFVKLESHKNFLARSITLPGDVLMNIVGPPFGKVSIVPDKYPEWNINQAIARFRCKPELKNVYLANYLISPKTIENMSCKIKTTAGQQNLTLEICRNITIPVPTLPEQVEIVRILDIIIEKENKAKQAAEAVLEQIDLLKKSILARAFRGKL